MRRWARVGASAIVASPLLWVALLTMFCLWAGTAALVSALAALPQRGATGALMLACIDAPFAGLLFANFLAFRNDLRELRTPQRRQLLTGLLAFFLALMVVAPCALALTWRLAPMEVLVVALGSATGAAGAFVRSLARARAAQRDTSAGGEMRATRSAPARSASRALRLALGPPYAPASWQSRLMQFAGLVGMLFVPALLVIAFGRSLSSRNFAAMMHAAEIFSVVAAIAWCWAWPLSQLVALFNPTRGASTELALLPGLGQGRRQLWRLSLVAVSPPAIALVLVLLIAMGAAWLERPSDDVYVKLAVEFSLVPLLTLPLLLGQIAHPQVRRSAPVNILILGPFYGLNSLIWNVSWEAFAAVPLLRWVSIAIVLLILASIVGVSLFLLRKVMRRPHLFVDVCS